jgi:phage shock protein PspC (stress-responsive transcriptional regulator)
MRTVITISLNGNAYQLDAVGFDALRAYLQVAEQRLAGNPDQEEILADLEQAIADKCNRYLGPHKNVVSASEVTEVLREMGPVDGDAAEAAAHSGAAQGEGPGGAEAGGRAPGGGSSNAGWSNAGAAGAGGTGGWSTGAGSAGGAGVDGPGSGTSIGGAAGMGSASDTAGASAGSWTAGSNGANAGSWTSDGTNNPGGAGQPGGATASGTSSTVRRLYQIREGAVISGVCKGLAAYLNMDASIVRILFIVLAVLTGGAWILVYIVMMFVIPYAETSEQHAAAHGLPFTAEEVIARAKAHYAAFTSGEKWRQQQWREQRRMWRSQNKMWKEQRRAWERAGGAAGGAPPPPPPWSATPPSNMSYSSQVMSGVLTPLVELIGALLFVAFLLALVSLATRHRLFGWSLPGDVPGWAAILVLIILYRALVSPLRQARYTAYYGTWFGAGWLALWGVLVWLAILSYFGWLAWQHWADVQNFFEQLTATLRNLINHEQPPSSQPVQAALQLLPGAPSCLLHLP